MTAVFQALDITDSGRALVPVLAGLADINDARFFGHLNPGDHAELERLLVGLVRHHNLKTVPTE
ncbi:MAG: hypothetical protein WDN06_07385 [Asticcacaulis sp.]